MKTISVIHFAACTYTRHVECPSCSKAITRREIQRDLEITMEGHLQVLNFFCRNFRGLYFRGSPACHEKRKNLHHAKISRYTVPYLEIVGNLLGSMIMIKQQPQAPQPFTNLCCPQSLTGECMYLYSGKPYYQRCGQMDDL